jgi:periplasmic protein TonB
MFELISGGPRHPFHDRTVAPAMISVVGHGVLVLGVVAITVFGTSEILPAVPDMMAFVAVAPAPPPPPPPPAPRRAGPAKPQSAPVNSRTAAPVEAPSTIMAESFVLSAEDEEGVEGGVEGGFPGGIPGGMVGGLVAAPAPPPPLPPPPAVTHPMPVRVGGQVNAPALVRRVEPIYPPIAVQAKLTGTVILEATVNTEGHVEEVRVLRSVGLLDAAAMEAVTQWRYSPLVLNGIPTPFILTVTLTFSLK